MRVEGSDGTVVYGRFRAVDPEGGLPIRPLRDLLTRQAADSTLTLEGAPIQSFQCWRPERVRPSWIVAGFFLGYLLGLATRTPSEAARSLSWSAM